eukprot:661742-Amphidinium_carterae.1
MKELVLQHSLDGCSKELLDIFAILRDSDALARMRFCMHAKNQSFYTSQLGIVGKGASSSAASSVPRQFLRPVEIHETDAEDADLAEL